MPRSASSSHARLCPTSMVSRPTTLTACGTDERSCFARVTVTVSVRGAIRSTRSRRDDDPRENQLALVFDNTANRPSRLGQDR